MTADSTLRPNNLQDFIHRLREWRWPEALQALQEDVLLVTDSDIGWALTEAYGPLRCRVATPDDYSQHVSPNTNKIVLLCRQGERAQVKEARRRHPALQVLSATYDFAPLSLRGGGYFEWLPVDAKGAENEPLVIIATPGSDADYLRQVLRENGLCDADEYLNRTLAAWASEQEDFEFFRFVAAVNRKHSGQRLCQIIYTDVLLDLVEHCRLTQWRFGNLLKQLNAQVIYFTRRDKSLQASLLAQVSPELGRSFWSADHLAQPRIIDSEPSIEELDQYLVQLLRQEATVEPMLSRLQKFKYLTIEEMVESPQEVLEAIATFLKKSAPAEGRWPKYERPYQKRPNLLKAAGAYRRTLIDRLGLHVNEHGSYVSGEQLLPE